MSICRWYGKELKDVTEHEQEKCYEQAGRECFSCGELDVGGTENEQKTSEESI